MHAQFCLVICFSIICSFHLTFFILLLEKEKFIIAWFYEMLGYTIRLFLIFILFQPSGFVGYSLSTVIIVSGDLQSSHLL